jgi:hypothetical protein
MTASKPMPISHECDRSAREAAGRIFVSLIAGAAVELIRPFIPGEGVVILFGWTLTRPSTWPGGGGGCRHSIPPQFYRIKKIKLVFS